MQRKYYKESEPRKYIRECASSLVLGENAEERTGNWVIFNTDSVLEIKTILNTLSVVQSNPLLDIVVKKYNRCALPKLR